MERICSPQAQQLPRPTSPASHPYSGSPLRPQGSRAISPAGRRGAAQSQLQPRRTPRPGSRAASPVLSALDAQPSAAGGADFIPERLSSRAAKGGGRRPAGAGGGGGGVPTGGALRDQGKLSPPGFITSQPPAKVRNAHLETG